MSTELAPSEHSRRDLLANALAHRLIRWALTAVGIAVLLAASVSIFRDGFSAATWADALSYAEGSSRFWGGMSPYTDMQLEGLYYLDAAAWGRGFVYPPSGALPLVPFTLGEAFFYAWNALSIAALVAVVLLIVRREFGHLPLPVALGVAAVTLLHPGMAGLSTGYVSPMVAAAVGTMWLWPRWSAIPAILFGLVKVYPLMGLVWTVRKKGVVVIPVVTAAGVVGASLLIQQAYWTDWLTALGNALPVCPEYALPSFACAGRPSIGYLLAVALLIGAWRVRGDRLSFALLGLAMIVPQPDIYWGHVMTAMVAALPLGLAGFQWTIRRITGPRIALAQSHSPSELLGTNGTNDG